VNCSNFLWGRKSSCFQSSEEYQKNAPRAQKKINKRQCGLSKTALGAKDKVLARVRTIETKTSISYRQNQEEYL
jgi:hypothetical protein